MAKLKSRVPTSTPWEKRIALSNTTWWFVCPCGHRWDELHQHNHKAPRRSCPKCQTEVKGGL